ncbi:hypothetical protein BJ912DRAFT_305228 [Pholiota molesta]|nr:hypothetical protein BJ912DRAFT_305228 [Pholiota molesta]
MWWSMGKLWWILPSKATAASGPFFNDTDATISLVPIRLSSCKSAFPYLCLSHLRPARQPSRMSLGHTRRHPAADQRLGHDRTARPLNGRLVALVGVQAQENLRSCSLSRSNVLANELVWPAVSVFEATLLGIL